MLLALALSAALPAAAGADVRVEGRGYGHGVGLSQYGAYGYALREGRAFDWILGHYYRGTRLERRRSRVVRVLLRRSSSQLVCGATLARDARGRRLRLSDSRRYRFVRAGGAALRVDDLRGRRTLARLRAPVRVRGGASVCLGGRAENGVVNGAYRGYLALRRAGAGVVAVNHVRSEAYLYGVVPAEMPTSWPLEAVKAQAVAARSYGLRGLRRGGAFDVYADVRSQVYRGVAGETARGRQAVRATSRLVVTHGGAIAQTFFFSTSGGRTAANEEVFGGAPVPYLRSVPDAHDDLSPVHRWTETFSQADAQRRLGSLVKGQLDSLIVVSRTPSGRAATVEVRGSGGSTRIAATTLRFRLGLRSTWFALSPG